MPLIGLSVAVIFGIGLDVAVSPGFGASKIIQLGIVWPVLAPFDFGPIIVPWVALPFGYAVWLLVLFVTVSVSGEAWPFGRRGINTYPEEHRFDFFSPLGLNGIGQLLDATSFLVITPFIYVSMVALEQELIREQTKRAQIKLHRTTDGANKQQRVITKAVLDQVPPFA